MKIKTQGIAIPSGLSVLYAHARKKNSEKGITGIISYKSNHYFQIIEGDDATVDELYNKINSDSRHEKVMELVNEPTNDRFFPKWNMKLTSLNGKENEFNSFIETFSDKLQNLPVIKLVGFKKFHNINKANPPSNVTSIRQKESYSGTTLKLTCWPDFNAFEPSPDFIEMCAKLINSPCSYEELFGTEGSLEKSDKLDHVLSELKTLGLLEVTENSTNTHKPKAPTPKPTPNLSNTGFYGQMRSFLGLRR